MNELIALPKSYVYEQIGNKPRGNLYYLKYDADKVIAELKESHKKEVKELLVLNRNQANSANRLRDSMEQAIRHQKYKRCLVMAQEWCNYAEFCGMQSHCHNHRGFGKTAEKYTWKEIHAWKCVHRYKELAEKFKPNNEVNNG